MNFQVAGTITTRHFLFFFLFFPLPRSCKCSEALTLFSLLAQINLPTVVAVHHHRVIVPNALLSSQRNHGAWKVIVYLLRPMIPSRSCNAGQQKQFGHPETCRACALGRAPMAARNRGGDTWVAEAGTYDQRSATMRSVRAVFTPLGPMRRMSRFVRVMCG